MTFFAKRLNIARMFGGSVLSQGLLSAANLLTGLILVRRVAQAQYGYYVLINSAVPLLAMLQQAFINPILASRVTLAPDQEARDYIGGLLRDQRRVLGVLGAAGLAVCALAWLTGLLSGQLAVMISFSVLAGIAWLFREFFRMVLASYRRPYEVLRADLAFVILMVGGVFLSTLTFAPATFAALTIAVAATVGGWVTSRALWRRARWNIHGSPGALAHTVRVGAWAASGSVIHWLFSQGYAYVVAGMLDVSSVAAIAATRLLLSPLGVFSLGIGTMMFSSSSLWLKHHGFQGLLRRVLLFAIAMACAAIGYIAFMWVIRDWVFLHIIKKDFARRDLLLAIWSLIFLSTVIRDQLIFILIAQNQFKRLAGLTLCCAVLGLSVSFAAIPHFGAAGGLLGLLAGEVAHVGGVLLFTLRGGRTPASHLASSGGDGFTLR